MHRSQIFFRRGSFPVAAFLVLLILLGGIFFTLRLVSQQQNLGSKAAIPPNDRAHGMVFDGLERSTDCPGGFKVHASATAQGKAHCTHGPDPISEFSELPPGPDNTPAPRDIALDTQPVTTPASPSAYICDGDGVSGNRIQVIYTHGSDVPDRYATYLTSFQTWASSMDWIYNTSAQQTGGTRHVRYVHDKNCLPVIPDVTLTPTGMSTFANMESELIAQGYNQSGRKYLVFSDTAVYCGIADIAGDDQPGGANLSNYSLSFARVDNGCWGPAAAAHETMHNLGGVQLSAPHSSGGWHCVDAYDRMCYSDVPYYPTMQYLCSSSQYMFFDCNHDDYYSTNPPPGNYLACHWNAANSAFLIGASSVTPICISITNPTNGSSVSLRSNVTVSISVANSVSVSQMVVTVNGNRLCSLTKGPYNCNWKVSGKKGTTYNINAKATDTSGNSASSSVSVIAQ